MFNRSLVTWLAGWFVWIGTIAMGGAMAHSGDVEFLEQNWDDATRQFFYTTTQGSRLLPYDWFMALEQADSTESFSGKHLLDLGFLSNAKSPANPDGLPVGFALDVDSVGKRHLGLTCAACHTNQIRFESKTFQIDGAPTLADTWGLLKGVGDALNKTNSSNDKWGRFATRILGSDMSAPNSAALKQEFGKFLLDYNAFIDKSTTAHPWGRGRLDAFGMIFNRVSSIDLEIPENSAPPDAPVSYPFLWGTSWENVVQWNGSIPNTNDIDRLGRNIGEVLGVFGQADLEKGTLFKHYYRSSANRMHLIQLENRLKVLWSPKWPEQIKPLVEARMERGKALFAMHCERCHQIVPHGKQDTSVVVELTPISKVKTDPRMAANAADRRSKTGRLQGSKIPGLDTLPAETSTGGLLQNVVRGALLSPFRDIDHFTLDASLLQHSPLELAALLRSQLFSPDEIRGFLEELNLSEEVAKEMIDTFAAKIKRYATDLQVNAGAPSASTNAIPSADERAAARERLMVYKGRPLDGIWATAPYLHNGSVPNLWELLLPANRRSKTFSVGNIEYDPVHVGFKTTQAPGTTLFDTSLPGNSNAGHDMYGDFDDEQRWDLVEFMKSL